MKKNRVNPKGHSEHSEHSEFDDSFSPVKDNSQLSNMFDDKNSGGSVSLDKNPDLYKKLNAHQEKRTLPPIKMHNYIPKSTREEMSGTPQFLSVPNEKSIRLSPQFFSAPKDLPSDRSLEREDSKDATPKSQAEDECKNDRDQNSPLLKKTSEQSECASNSESEDNKVEQSQQRSEKGEKRKKERTCFWRAHSQAKIRFDLFIIVLVLINCFQVPFVIAFMDISQNYTSLVIMNTIIDFIYCVDIFINFRTSFVSTVTGEEFSDCKRIALNYLRGKFWVDFLASLPVTFISFLFHGIGDASTILQLLGLLKLVRITRLSRLIAYIDLKSEFKMSLKITKLIFFLVIYLH